MSPVPDCRRFSGAPLAAAVGALGLGLLFQPNARADEINNPPEQDDVTLNHFAVLEGDGTKAYMNCAKFVPVDTGDTSEDVPETHLTVLPDADGSARITLDYSTSDDDYVHYLVVNEGGTLVVCGDTSGDTIEIPPEDFVNSSLLHAYLFQTNPRELLAYATVSVGECTACGAGSCVGRMDLDVAEDGRVTFVTYTGTMNYGQESGRLLWSLPAAPTADIVPDDLKFSGGATFLVDEAGDEWGVIAHPADADVVYQIRAEDMLVVIDDDDSADDKYEIHYYASHKVGSFQMDGTWGIATDPSTMTAYVPDRVIKIEDLGEPEMDGVRKILFEEYSDWTTLEISHSLEWDPSTKTWAVYEGVDAFGSGYSASSYLRETTTARSWNGSVKTVTQTISDETTEQHKEENEYTDYGWGAPRTSRTLDPGGADITSSWEYYQDPTTPSPGGTPGVGRAKKTLGEGDCGWVHSKYDANGRLTERVSQFKDRVLTLDSGTPTEPTQACKDDNRVTEISYDDTNWLRREKKILEDEPVAITYIVQNNDDKRTEHRFSAFPGNEDNPTFTADNLATSRERYASTHAYDLRLKRVEWPDGTASEYTYEAPFSYEDEDPEEEEGNSVDTWKTTVESGYESGGSFTKGTKTVTITHPIGTVLDRKVTDIASLEETEWRYVMNIVDHLDNFGRATEIFDLAGNTEQYEYACCGLKKRTDVAGTETTFGYDDLRRRTTTTTNGVTLTSTLDALGRTTKVVRTATGSADSYTLELNIFNKAGQLLSSKDALGGTTNYEEEEWENILGRTLGKKRSTTNPADGENADHEHRVEYFYCDGSLAKVERGTYDPVAQEADVDLVLEYDYGSEDATNHTWSKETRVTDDGMGGDSKDEWTKTYRDMLGRLVNVELPDAGGAGTVETEHFYNDEGQLGHSEDPDGVTTVYEYDELGRRDKVAVDMDDDDEIEEDGPTDSDDRITVTDVTYTTKTVGSSTNTVRKTETKVYPEQDSGTDPPVTVSTAETSLTSNESWVTQGGVVTHTVTDYSYGGDGDWTVTTKRYNSSSLTSAIGSFSVSTYEDGRLDSVETYEEGDTPGTDTPLTGTSYTYDEHGRRDAVTDQRTGTTEYTFKTATDLVEDIVAPNPADKDATTGKLTTSLTYDNRGRVIERDLPDTGSQENVQTYEYFENGQLKRRYGDLDYPALFAYDRQGRLTKMTTWRDVMDPSTATENSSTAENTTWTYNSERGWLDSKDYDDGKGTDYEYTDAGRLAKRTWARLDGMDPLETVYNYHDDSGDLLSVDYSDGTPDVLYAYTRLGQPETVKQGDLSMGDITNPALTHTYTYDSTYPHRPDTETVAGLIAEDLTLTRNYETATTELNRYAGFELGHEVGMTLDPDADHKVTYSYHADEGRLDSVATGDLEWFYSYEAGTDRVNLLALLDTNVAKYEIAYTFGEEGRNTVTGVENRNDTATTTYSKHTYVYNEIAQRTSVANTDSGSYYPMDGEHTRWKYHDSGELKTSIRYEGTDPEGATPTEVTPNQDYRFTFDLIGNREEAEDDGTSTDYTANDLNQYTLIDDGTEASSPTYDNDGNMTNDGIQDEEDVDFTWDSENRLVKAEPATPLDLDLRHRFEYDYLGRRVRTLVDRYDSGTGEWEDGVEETHYLYDGWNVVSEYNKSYTQTKTYTWGLDLSGSLQGAGGVGGLLACKELTGTLADTYYYLYDANGNVTELLDSSLNVDAHYEYTPFGREIVATGDYADTNFYRFSTKPLDGEFLMYYYGYRYYSPVLGRWLNRDPLEESGGYNLYIAFGNNPIIYIDPFGLEWWHDVIPIYGPVRNAMESFDQGNYGWGVLHGAIAISDVFIARAIITSCWRGAWKVGGVSWSTVSSWYRTNRPLPKGTHIHHWLVHRNGQVATFLRHYFPNQFVNRLINQPWNLLPMLPRGRHAWMSSQMYHFAVHGWGENRFRVLGRLWHGTPHWAKNAMGNITSRIATMFERPVPEELHHPGGILLEAWIHRDPETGNLILEHRARIIRDVNDETIIFESIEMIESP